MRGLFYPKSVGVLPIHSLGDFANYGDAEVQSRIDSVKLKPESYASLMTEIAYAAWYFMRGYSITAHAADSLPDFKVNHPELPLPIIADCKRIGENTSSNRYGSVIKKANKQIKALGEEGYGFTVLDVSDKMKQVFLGGGNRDELPEAVLEAQACVRQSLVGCNKSVSGVVIQWDECEIGKGWRGPVCS